MPHPTLANGLTPKQEGFAQSYVETSNLTEAYRRNYNCDSMKIESIHRKAFEVRGNVKVAARIDSLMAANQKKHEVTVDSIHQMYVEDREFARECGNASASLAASVAIARLHGLDRQRVEVVGDPILQMLSQIAESSQSTAELIESRSNNGSVIN